MKKERLIIEIHGNIPVPRALYCVHQVVMAGKISGPKHRRQHCYHSVMGDNIHVSVVRRNDVKSERFILYRGKK